MAAYIVEYGLVNPDKNHPRLSKAIRENTTIGTYWSSLG